MFPSLLLSSNAFFIIYRNLFLTKLIRKLCTRKNTLEACEDYSKEFANDKGERFLEEKAHNVIDEKDI